MIALEMVESGDFAYGLSFERQMAQEIRLQRRRYSFINNLLNGQVHLFVRKMSGRGEFGV